MANHVRRQLRDAVTTALTGLTTTGARVYGFRVYALDPENELPALSIYITEEDAQGVTIHGPASVERIVSLHVKGFARAGSGLDDTLDLIAKEVETVLGAALTIGSHSVLLAYQGCEIEHEAGDQPIASIDIKYTATLFNTATAPDVLT